MLILWCVQHLLNVLVTDPLDSLWISHCTLFIDYSCFLQVLPHPIRSCPPDRVFATKLARGLFCPRSTIIISPFICCHPRRWLLGGPSPTLLWHRLAIPFAVFIHCRMRGRLAYPLKCQISDIGIDSLHLSYKPILFYSQQSNIMYLQTINSIQKLQLESETWSSELTICQPVNQATGNHSIPPSNAINQPKFSN